MSRAIVLAGGICAILILVGVVIATAASAKEPPSELYVRTLPPGAKVLVDGKQVGTSDDLFKVEPGARKIEVELEGYEPAGEEVTIAETKIERVVFELKKTTETAKSQSEKSTLGPVIEEVLHDMIRENNSRTAELLDLDTQRRAVMRDFGKNDRQTHEWIRQQKVDVTGVIEKGQARILMVDTAVIEIPDGRWNTITAAEIEDNWALRQKEPDKISTLPNGQNIKQQTCIFETREGGMGVLQIGGAADNPKGVKIRYRLVKKPDGEEGDALSDAWQQGEVIPGVTYSRDKKVAFAGKASLCIEKKVNRYFPIAAWTQTVQRKGDAATLELSAQVKARKMTKAILDVVFLDENDQWISHKWAAYIGSQQEGQPPADHDWKKYSGKVDIPPGTVKLLIGLQVYGPGTVWFDDVRVRSIGEKQENSDSQEKSNTAEKSQNKEADRMIELVEDFFSHNFRDVTTRKTIEWGDVQNHPNGNKSIRYKYLASIWDEQSLVMNQIFTFDAEGKFVKYENVEGFPQKADDAKIPPATTDKDLQRRTIAKKVADFPEAVDLSSPESAWAAYHRASAREDAKAVVDLSWVKIDPADMEQFWKKEDPADMAVYNKAQLDAECVEALVYRGELAAVISRLEFPPGKGRHPFSIRSFGLIDGKWKNLGEDRLPTLEAARTAFQQKKDVILAHFKQIKERVKKTEK